jgi:serine/threonine protein phosphatase PrpC
MADRWFYAHGGQTQGPVTVADLRRLLADGRVSADDEAWEEPPAGQPPSRILRIAEVAGIAPPHPRATQTMLPPYQPPPPPASTAPDWLSDVAEAEGAEPPQGDAELDWLADVVIPPAGPAAEGEPAAAPPAAVGPARLAVGGATSRGCVRERNEDRFLVQQLAWSDGDEGHELAVLMVCDGMGGHQAGDRASSLAVRTMTGTLTPVLAGILQGPSREAGAAVLTRHLERAFQDAHTAILRRAESDAACKGMGSTAAAAVVWDDRAFLAHVGDCRIYHQHGDQLTQVTRDQTLVARMVEMGQLTEAEAARHPARNEVTQALGKRGKLEPSRQALKLERGDRLILACDGLAAHVDEATLRETAAGWTGSAADLARRLLDLANEGGGSDNCTVLVAQCL